MNIEEIDRDEQYKVLALSLNAGEALPLHYTTSEAMLIARKGRGKIIFSDRQLTLSPGETLMIPANEAHKMDVQEDFSTYLVLDLQARILFSNPGSPYTLD